MGTVSTGDPGTEASVVNSGDEHNAVFDFVIPKGDVGTMGVPDALAATDIRGQRTRTNGALVFGSTALSSGPAITHQDDSPDVVITQNGIYQVSFFGSVRMGSCAHIPAALNVHLFQDNVRVSGAVSRHVFCANGEVVSMVFSMPIRVNRTPVTLQMRSSADDFFFENATLTVMRLGEES